MLCPFIPSNLFVSFVLYRMFQIYISYFYSHFSVSLFDSFRAFCTNV